MVNDPDTSYESGAINDISGSQTHFKMAATLITRSFLSMLRVTKQSHIRLSYLNLQRRHFGFIASALTGECIVLQTFSGCYLNVYVPFHVLASPQT